MVTWERAVVASFTLGIVNSFLGLTGGWFFLWKHEKYPGLGHEIFVLFFVGVVEAASWIYESVKFEQMDEDDAPPSYSDFRKIAPFRNFLLVQIVLFWCLRAQRGPLAKHNVLVRVLSLSHTLLASFVFIILAWFETFDDVYWEISMAFVVNILVTLLGFLFGIHNKCVQKSVYHVCNCCNCHYLHVMYLKCRGKDKYKEKDKEKEKESNKNNNNGDNNDDSSNDNNDNGNNNNNKKKKGGKYHEIGYSPLRYGVKGMLILICIHSIFLANLDIIYDNKNLFWLWDSYDQWTLYSHIVNRSLTFCYLIMIYFVINDRSNFLPWLCPSRHNQAKSDLRLSMSLSTTRHIEISKKKSNNNKNNKGKNDSNNGNNNENENDEDNGDNGVIYREMSSISVVSPVSPASPGSRAAESQSPQSEQSGDEINYVTKKEKLTKIYNNRKIMAESNKYQTIKTTVIGSEEVGKTLYIRALWQGDFPDNQDRGLEPKCGNLGNLNNYNRYNLYDYYCRWHRHLKTAYVFWDTIGDLRFTLNSLDRMRNSHVIMLMYNLDECLNIDDVSKAKTLVFLQNFNQQLKTILELKDDNEMSEIFPVLLAGVTKHSMDDDIMMKDKLIETHKKVVEWSKSAAAYLSENKEKTRLLSLFGIVNSQIIHSLTFDATSELSIYTLLDTFFRIEKVGKKRESSLPSASPLRQHSKFKRLLNKFNLGSNNKLYPSLPHKKIDKKLKNQGKFISLILRKHIDTEEAISDDEMKRNYVATQLSILQETQEDEKSNDNGRNNNGNNNGNEIEEKERVGDGDSGAMAFIDEYINQKAEENSKFSTDVVIGPISVRYKEIKRKRFYIFCRFIVCLAFGILFPLILVMQTTVFWLYSDIWGYSNDGLLEWFSSNYSFFTLGQLPMDVLFGLPWFERPASDPLQGGLRSCFEGNTYSNPDSNAAFSNTEIDWFLRQTVSQKIGRTIIAFLCCVLWSLMGYNVIYYVKYSNNEDSILFGANEISNVEALGGVFLFIWLWIMVSSWYAGNTVITNSNLHLNAQAPERQSMKMCYKDMSKNDGTKNNNKNNNNNNIYTNVDIFLQSYTFYRNEAKLHSFGKGTSKKLIGILILSSLILAFIPAVVRAAQHLPAFGADYDYIEDYLSRVTGSNSTITIDDYSDYNYNFTSAEIEKYAKAQENTASRAILINFTMILIIQIVALRIVQNSFREYKLLMNYITKIIEISHDGDSTKTSENNNVSDSSHRHSHSRTASVTKKRETKFKLINSPSNGSITTRTATNKKMDMPNMPSTKLKKAAAASSSSSLHVQLSRVRSRRGSTVKRVHSLLGDSQNQYESNSIIAEQEDMKQLESQSGLVFLSLDDPFNLIAFMEVRDYGFVFGRQLFGELELFMVIAVFAIVVQTAYAIALLWRTDGIHEFGQSIFVAYWCLVMTIAWALRVLYYGVQFDKLQSRQVEALIHQTACIRSSIITTAIFEGPERWNMFKVGTWDRLYKLKRAYSDLCKSNFNNNNNNKNGMFDKEIYYSNENKEMLEDEQDSFNQYMKLMELFTKEVELNIINPNIIGIRISGTLAKAAIGTGIGFVVAIVKVLFF